MAKKGGRDILTRSQLNAGDEYFELTCTRCSKKNKNKQSVKYCAACKQYFCKDCLEIHDDFHSSAGHVLVDTDTDSRILSLRNSGRDIQIVPTELCKEHPMEVVNMYCKDDDNVGCRICFVLHHRSCTEIEYIPRYVQEYDPNPTIDHINRKLTTAFKHIETWKTNCDERDVAFEKSKADCKKEINQYRQDIKDVIDEIEERTLAELETEYNNRKQYNTDQNLKIQDLKSNLKRFQDGIVSEQVNLAQKFVLAMIGRKLVEQSETMKSRSTEEQTSTFEFSRNTDILAFLLNIFTLGMLTSPGSQDTLETASRSKQAKQTTFIATRTTTSITSTTMSGATGSNICTEGNVRVEQQSEKQCLYKVVNRSKYNIKQSDDRYVCRIMSSCITNNDNIVLVDYNNNMIKLVDSKTYNIISSLLFDVRPLSVCSVSRTEVAVCLDNTTIKFLSTCNNLVVTRSLSMKHYCRCITVSRDRMYICDNRSLYIYNMNGTLIKKVKEIKSGDKIFSNIYDITISDDHNMIHIVDFNKGAITLDMNSKICWEFSGAILNGPHGVRTDGSGNVILCGYVSHNIILLGHNGHYMGEIVIEQEVSIPRAVCFDKNNKKMIVGCDSDCIIVLTLK
ncbi:hypothetical protein ACF0H5_024325 [Mactra antiquata]